MFGLFLLGSSRNMDLLCWHKRLILRSREHNFSQFEVIIYYYAPKSPQSLHAKSWIQQHVSNQRLNTRGCRVNPICSHLLSLQIRWMLVFTDIMDLLHSRHFNLLTTAVINFSDTKISLTLLVPHVLSFCDKKKMSAVKPMNDWMIRSKSISKNLIC